MGEPEKNKKSWDQAAKYSAISFQMLATIGLFAFAGYKIDQHRTGRSPLFTALLSLAGVVVSLIQVIRQLNKNRQG